MNYLKSFEAIFIMTINAEILHQSFNIKKTFGKFKGEPGKRMAN